MQQRPCKFITGPRLFALTLRLLGVGQVFTVHGTNKLRFHGPRYQQPRTVNKRSAFKSTVSMSKPLAPGAKAASTTSARVLNLALGGWQSRTLGGEILALQKRIFIRLLICSSVNGTACLHKCPGLVDQSPHLQLYVLSLAREIDARVGKANAGASRKVHHASLHIRVKRKMATESS